MPKRNREAEKEWHAFLDVVVKECDEKGGEAYDFDSAWDPKAFLPAEVPVTENIKSLVAESREEHAEGGEGGQTVYARRMTNSEAFYAQPKRPTEVDIFARHGDPTGQALAALGAREGPDFRPFLDQSRSDAIETRLSTFASEVTPQRGVIGTAMSPAFTPGPQRSLGLLRKECNFIPIIIVPNSVSAILQMWNIQNFLEKGVYEEASEYFLDKTDGTARQKDKPKYRIVTPGRILPNIDSFSVKFRYFRVVDRAEAVTNWNQVAACIVTGQQWQLQDWYHGDRKLNDPSVLFTNTRGFMPYFEEDKPPATIDTWKVQRIQLSRKSSKFYSHIQAAKTFWEETFRFMDTHPNFRQFTQPASEEDLEVDGY